MPLQITIPANEFWDFRKEEFINTVDTTIHIEHSLAAIAKWEGRWRKPFLSNEALSGDQLLDYIRCMTLEESIDPRVYLGLSHSNMEAIRAYIESPMTATWFKEERRGKRGTQVLTAEIIYYYMVELGIPFECENWHFNRLMTLIRVCSEKQAVPKKMSRKEIFAQNAAWNAKQKARLGTRG